MDELLKALGIKTQRVLTCKKEVTVAFEEARSGDVVFVNVATEELVVPKAPTAFTLHAYREVTGTVVHSYYYHVTEVLDGPFTLSFPREVEQQLDVYIIPPDVQQCLSMLPPRPGEEITGNFERLVREIEQLPKTWVPAIVDALVQRACDQDVYQPGGLTYAVLQSIERWEETHERK